MNRGAMKDSPIDDIPLPQGDHYYIVDVHFHGNMLCNNAIWHGKVCRYMYIDSPICEHAGFVVGKTDTTTYRSKSLLHSSYMIMIQAAAERRRKSNMY